MNNAAYLVHCEMARWELSAASGLLGVCMQKRGAFLVATSAVRYRRPISPMQRFEVHTSLAQCDERTVVFDHAFVAEGQVHARAVCRAVVKSPSGLLSPSALLGSLGLSMPTTVDPQVTEAVASLTQLDRNLKDIK
eukprot:5131203-Pleurochrysis_carterae.AAC.3